MHVSQLDHLGLHTVQGNLSSLRGFLRRCIESRAQLLQTSRLFNNNLDGPDESQEIMQAVALLECILDDS